VAGTLLLSGELAASGKLAAPLDPLYVEECGSCHVAYPPRMLSAASWQALLGGLNRHFGSDASLEEAARGDIGGYLESHARKRATAAEGKPVIRITETGWFRHEHGDISERTWKNPAVKSPANCGACHTTAEKGIYSEHNLRIPTNTGNLP
jgi:hypothetical protein